MRLICEATHLTDWQVKKLTGLLEVFNCEISSTEDSVVVDYKGPLNQDSLAIIALVESQGCHRVVMTNSGGENG